VLKAGAGQYSMSGSDAVLSEIRRAGLEQMSDTGALETIVDQVLAANPKSIDEYKAGKDKAFNALVGQVMKASQGKANPSQVNELLKKKLVR
jgi:aspartyl-tRNA(Asn)/glutamyl-tRNA(Gln) amidotransferase subunit B